MSSKHVAAVFSQCGLSSKARDLLAECVGISRDVEPTPKDMIRVEAVGSGAFIANILRSEYMISYHLQKLVAAIVGKPLQIIGFTEGHGGVEFTRGVDECPKTMVFVMYYKMCRHCDVNTASEFRIRLGLMCSDCAKRYHMHSDYLEDRPFQLHFMRPCATTHNTYLKTRQPVQPSIEQLLFGEDYQKQRKRKRNNKWPRTGKSTIYSHKPNRMHR
jgi:hypothetical protein